MEDFTMKTTKKALKALMVALLAVNVSYGDCGYSNYKNFNFNISCQLWGNRYVGLNNPLNADSKLSMAYSITLDSPIVIKPTKIDMDEHITTDSSDEDSIYYQTITKEIIDPNTKQCVKYPNTEFVLDSSGKKQCVGNQLTEKVAENDKNKITKPKVDSDGNPICDDKGYKKHTDWNESKKGQCKTQEVRLYSTGVTFTPNYDDSLIDKVKYCKAGETQSFEAIEEKRYEMPEELNYEVDNNGNATDSADGKSSYYKAIEKIKNNALNVENYSKTINKVLCIADNNDSNMNAYIIGAVVNYYKAKNNNGLTKLEVESLKDMSLNVTNNKWKTKRKVATINRCTGHREEKLLVNFKTKENWGNNQRIYEYEMYRPFRRPDGTTFYLYERQGFFTDEGKVECVDCARDDEING